MSTVVLAQQDFFNPGVVPIPPLGDFTIGFHMDGIPYVKYSDGTIIPLIGSGPIGPIGPTGPTGLSVGGGNSLIWKYGNKIINGQFNYPNGNWGIPNVAYNIDINRYEGSALSDANNWFNVLDQGISFVGPSKGIFSIYQTDNNQNFALFTLNSIADNSTYWTINANLVVFGNNPSPIGGKDYNISFVLFGKDAISSGTMSLNIESNSGIIEISGTSSTTLSTKYDTLLNDSLAMPASVGGISAGTSASVLKSKNFVELFDSILFPVVYPTYTIPTISLSSTITGIKEVGSTYSTTLVLTGSENDASTFTQLDIYKSINGGSNILLISPGSLTASPISNLPDQFGMTNSNNPNYSYMIQYFDYSVAVPTYSSSNSTISYIGYGNYSGGLPLYDNKGLTDSRSYAVRSTSAPQSAGINFGPVTSSIIGYYPYFYGKSLTQQNATQIKSIIESGVGFNKVINTGAGSISMPFNAVGEWPWFAIFESYSTKSTWYSTPLNNGSIGSVTDLFASPTNLSVISSDGYWIANYKIYPSNKVTTISTAIIS